MAVSEVIALMGLLWSITNVLLGWMIAQRNRKIDTLETKVDLANRTVETKQETIDELRHQLNRLTITAEIQEKFFGALPRQLPSSSGDR